MLVEKRLILLFILVGLLSCQQEERYGDEKIFRLNIPEGVQSLDPAFARNLANINASNQLFNGLVQMDAQLEVAPCIAKSWEILDSGSTYLFHLRNDVFFHPSQIFKDSTRKLNANDVVYSFNRIIDPELISPGKWVFNIVERDSMEQLSIQVINDTTLQISLKQAFPPFLGLLSMQYCSILPHEVVQHYGDDFRQSPIGTGPFKFEYWKENGKLVLLKNKNYFEKDRNGNQLPYLDAVSISFIKDQEISFLKFVKGELDLLSGLKGAYKDELLTSQGELNENYSKSFNLLRSPYLNTEYLGIYQDSTAVFLENSPLRFKSFRKALNIGFNREKMIKYLRNGVGIPANVGMIPSGLPGHNGGADIAYEYNPEKAKQLILERAYSSIEAVPEFVISTTSEYLDICEYLQHQWGQLGLKVKIEVNPPATNNDLIANGAIALFRKSWIADYPDAENYLSLFKSSNFSPDGPNYTHYSNEQFDSWYTQALINSEPQERSRLYQKMDSLVMEDAPVIPLFYDEVMRFIPKSITGMKNNPMNLLVLKNVNKLD